jgi:hypothetical protein
MFDSPGPLGFRLSKFNTVRSLATSITARLTSPVTTQRVPSVRTHAHGEGYVRDTKSELFMLAVTNMVAEPTFYETGGERDSRYVSLVRQATLADPDWTGRLLSWLRVSAHMRSAPLVGAAEFTKARLDTAQHGMSRQVVNSVLQRSDEPGEILAYWISRYGRSIPKPLKRGVADAAQRLYNERSLLKYDTVSAGVRFADVLSLTHPTARVDTDPSRQDDAHRRAQLLAHRSALYRHILGRRHGSDSPIPDTLPILRSRATLMAVPVAERRAYLRAAEPGTPQGRLWESAAMTWEALAGWLQSPMDAAAWERIIPSMGYMALLRNLRNFDEAGICAELAAEVAAKLSDPDEVARSRQFPFRFLSAYETAPNLRWGPHLDTALRHSLRNLPALPGRSLVLVDTSGSMQSPLSGKSTMSCVRAAAVFGIALAARNTSQVDVIGFADGTFRHHYRPGASVISEIGRFVGRVGEAGHGTNIPGALRRSYNGHDRVFVISDMQTAGHGVSTRIPADVPLYGFNLNGYRSAAYASGGANRHEFGGLTDATFQMIPLLETGRNADWPF